MSLRKRTALVILLTLLGLVSLLFGISHTILEDGFLRLEEREAQINIERVRNALDEQLNFIASKTQDWAVWDDTYKFVQDKNQAYIDSNISENTLSNLKINVMIFADKNNKIVHAIQNMNPDIPAMQAITENTHIFLKPNSFFTKHSSNNQTHKGLVILPEGPLLLVSKPIVPTNVEGEIQGTLLFGKFVDAATVARLSEVTKLPIEAMTKERASSSGQNDIAEAFLQLSSTVESRLKAHDASTMYGYTLFHDVDQIPALVLRVAMKREVLQQGKRTIETMIIAIVSAGGIFGLIIFALLEKSVVARVLNLSQTVTRISQSPDPEERLDDKGKDEIKYLSDSINGMLDTIHERNQTIRNIFDNVSFGLFICDKHMIIAPGVTQSCYTLFAQDKIEGQHLPQLLGLDKSTADWMETFYQQIFDDFLPLEVTLGQLPSKFKIGDRHIKLEGKVLRDAAGGITSVLFSVSDVSKLELIERDNREHRTLVKILKSPAAFTDFLKEARLQFTEMRDAVNQENHAAIRRPLHTLKGNYSIFDLMDIVQTIHTIEEKAVVDQPEIDRIEKETRDFLEKNQDVLQIQFDEPSELTYTLSETELLRIEEDLSHLVEEPEGLDHLLTEVGKLRRKPVRELFGPIEELVEGLSRRLCKEIDLELRGFELRIEPQLLRPVVDILPHLIRNAVDHGIEESAARRDKPARGRLIVSIEDDEESVLVRVSDDGRGLNLKALTLKAQSLGLLSEAEAAQLSLDQQADLIFKDSLSTADSVSDISGRGVGMAAVKETIEQAGGQMRVINRPGLGLTVEMLLKRAPSAGSVILQKKASA